MKVLVHGGLNLSELDGWWAEAYTPGVGWALGDGKEHGDDPAWDALEAAQLYDILEQQVVPEFYARDHEGAPTAWIVCVRASMESLTPRYSANRSVREYTEQHYHPAATAYRKRAADSGALGKAIAAHIRETGSRWKTLRIERFDVQSSAGDYVFDVHIALGEFGRDAMRVELYANAAHEGEPIRHAMTAIDAPAESPGRRAYRARIAATRPASDYTVRVIPDGPDLAIPLEANQILWRR